VPDRIWEAWWRASGRAELTRLLSRGWDPIFRGMAGQAPPDEYEDQADQIGALLDAGATRDELADWLQNAENAMHLLPDDGDLALSHQVAREILDWYGTSAPPCA
jgi:hypothetical protein